MSGFSPNPASALRLATVLAVAGVVCAPGARAAEPVRLSGILAGRVMDAAGVPQMGAAVILYNRFDRMLAKVITGERGTFSFDSLSPDLYSIRVSLNAFMPALQRNINIQPGMRSFLAINLKSVLSSIELVYMAPGRAPVMSDEWRWVLRSSSATRPVLRYLPGVDITDPNRPVARPANLFSGTRGVFRLSSGEGGPLSHAGNQTDLGTAFALATSVFGVNHVSVSGAFGYASHSGTPTAGFRTSYSRAEAGMGPEVNVTMRQMFLPSRIGAALASGRNDNIPALQTLSVSFLDRKELAEGLNLEYGSTIESVSFLTRLNYVSPFARLRWGSAESGAVELAYSSGAPAVDLLAPGEVADAGMQHQLNTLALFPRVSLRDGGAHVQRAQNFELGYRRTVGHYTLAASAYRESVSNAAFNAAAPAGTLGGVELLPDLASRTSVFNGGNFRRMGYTASVSQQVTDKTSATLAYSFGGALSAGEGLAPGTDAQAIRSLLRVSGRHSLTARMAGVAPGLGTRYAASYQFTDYRALNPVHLSLTQRSTLEPGLNLYLRQPIPGILGLLPGRLEASAELRNMLSQGYLPIATPGGYKLLLIQSPRAVRGGVSLIF